MEKAAGNPGRLAKAASVVVISLCVILFLLYRSLSGEIAGGKSWQSGLGTEPAGSGERIPGAEAAGDLSGTERAGSLSGGEPGKDMEDSRSGTGLRAGQSGLPDEDKQQEREEAQRYRDFLERLEAVKNIRETAEYGFIVIEEQIFPFTMEGGREVSLVPAIDRESRRLVLFFVGQEDEIAFRTEQLEANQQIPGSWKQGTREVAAVSFPDLDGDGLNDVVLVALCNTREDGTGMTAKVGDVLFQRQGGFYQDWRLSDRINRFGMNKSVKMILSFVREGDFAGVFYRAAGMGLPWMRDIPFGRALRSWGIFLWCRGIIGWPSIISVWCAWSTNRGIWCGADSPWESLRIFMRFWKSTARISTGTGLRILRCWPDIPVMHRMGA